MPKIRQLGIVAQICRAISSHVRHVSTIGKKLVKDQYLPTCPDNMVNFGPLTAEIRSGVWGTQANFNGFRVLAALLHDILVVARLATIGHRPRIRGLCPLFGRGQLGFHLTQCSLS